MAKKRPVTVRRVILDGRNRELAYMCIDEDVQERIRQLKKLGKKPTRIIIKSK